METRLYFIHALSSLHAGTGQGAGVIDLPIARERPTGLPIVPGSTVKGVKREAMPSGPEKASIYGPETANASDHAGAIVFGDARLLCLPVRSYVGTFAWATSPYVLLRLAREIPDLPSITIAAGHDILLPAGSELAHAGKVYLEDMDLRSRLEQNREDPAGTCCQEIACRVFPGDVVWQGEFRKRFAVLSDDLFKFLYEHAVEVNARIKINEETRTVADGALWYEESLPAESILWGVAGSDAPRKSATLTCAWDVLDRELPSGQEKYLQVGGKATVGRGRIRFIAD